MTTVARAWMFVAAVIFVSGCAAGGTDRDKASAAPDGDGDAVPFGHFDPTCVELTMNYPPPSGSASNGLKTCSEVGAVCDWGEVTWTCLCDGRWYDTYDHNMDVCGRNNDGGRYAWPACDARCN